MSGASIRFDGRPIETGSSTNLPEQVNRRLNVRGALTGKFIDRWRVCTASPTYSASAFAADGHLYFASEQSEVTFASEQGEVTVIEEGDSFN